MPNARFYVRNHFQIPILDPASWRLSVGGLVERRPDPQDGRRVVLSVTDAGREVLQNKRNARTEQLAQALSAGFTPAEVTHLMAAVPLLERLAQSI